jgi:hypothetical protein
MHVHSPNLGHVGCFHVYARIGGSVSFSSESFPVFNLLDITVLTMCP